MPHKSCNWVWTVLLGPRSKAEAPASNLVAILKSSISKAKSFTPPLPGHQYALNTVHRSSLSLLCLRWIRTSSFVLLSRFGEINVFYFIYLFTKLPILFISFYIIYHNLLESLSGKQEEHVELVLKRLVHVRHVVRQRWQQVTFNPAIERGLYPPRG